VERLTERVVSVAADGTATLLLTLTAEPGFEDADHPQATLTRTVTVRPDGQVQAVAGAALGNGPEERDLLAGIVPLGDWAAAAGKSGLGVMTRAQPPVAVTSESPDHDGTLLQTTRAVRTDRIVFDGKRGRLVRRVSTLTVAISLVMTGRGRRGSDDFGHVVPTVQVVQTLTVEGKMD